MYCGRSKSISEQVTVKIKFVSFGQMVRAVSVEPAVMQLRSVSIEQETETCKFVSENKMKKKIVAIFELSVLRKASFPLFSYSTRLLYFDVGNVNILLTLETCNVMQIRNNKVRITQKKCWYNKVASFFLFVPWEQLREKTHMSDKCTDTIVPFSPVCWWWHLAWWGKKIERKGERKERCFSLYVFFSGWNLRAGKLESVCPIVYVRPTPTPMQTHFPSSSEKNHLVRCTSYIIQISNDFVAVFGFEVALS